MYWQLRSFSFLFIWWMFCDTPVFTAVEHLSDIEIVPPNVVINAMSSIEFICRNYRSNEEELEADLSKSIISDQIKISTINLNKTSKRIQLDVYNYTGCFHVLCYVKGQRSDGIYADVIVKAAPGVLQLVRRCEVHERQYTKCMIRAPVIATAIQNGCSPQFKFEEDKHPSALLAYRQPPDFLYNASTKEILVFIFKPTIDGEFPSQIRMNMTQRLRYFNPTWYIFDMTPIFVIKPKFIVTAISSNKIQINLTSISSPAFCERSIMPSFNSMTNRTWRIIESGQNSILESNLAPNEMYHVCIKCRQVYNDPEGLEQCQEIKTLKDNTILFVIVVIVAIIVPIIIIGVVIFYFRKRPKYELVHGKAIQRVVIANHYDRDPTRHSGSSTSLRSDGTISELAVPLPYSDENETAYLPIASAEEFLDASFPKILHS